MRAGPRAAQPEGELCFGVGVRHQVGARLQDDRGAERAFVECIGFLHLCALHRVGFGSADCSPAQRRLGQRIG
ncbi:hypothetical protein D3C85_1750520 [compost metagenome]